MSIGIHLPLPIQTFGFFVAISFMAAAYTVSKELKRKSSEGLIPEKTKKVVVGKPASSWDYLMNILIGFLLGFKLIFLLTNYLDFVADPQGSILSTKGNAFGGILGAILFFYLKA